MKATCPASQENADDLTCPPGSSRIGNSTKSHVDCSVRLSRWGWQEGGGSWPWATGPVERLLPGSSRRRGETQQGLGRLPLHCEVLQGLMAPPHTGRVPGMQTQASVQWGLLEPGPWLLEIVGLALTLETSTAPLTKHQASRCR